jgi:hypothetical protein
MFVLESIPFTSKSGWIVESIPMYRKQAEALLRSRLANRNGNTRRYRVVKVN